MCYLLRITNVSYCIFFFSFHVHTAAALGSTNIWPTMLGKWT
jgi:hypothetical protein